MLTEKNKEKAEQLKIGIKTDQDIEQQLQLDFKSVGTLAGTMVATIDYHR